MKYQPLADFLAARNEDCWEATFGQVENVLRFPLPRSAFEHRPWWANQSGPAHSQTKGWSSVGWKTTRVSLQERRVTFVRDHESDNVNRTPSGVKALQSLFERASQITGIIEHDALTEVALHALIDRHAGHGLAALGGSMPDYQAPTRERP